MSIRMERVASLLQREIASILSRDFSDQLKPMVTVTSVRVTADLSIAYIYLSIMGESRAGKDSVLGHLKDLTPRIRGILGKAIRHQVKSIPELRFFLDESLESAKRMDDLLGRLKDERRRRGVDDADDFTEVGSDHSGSDEAEFDEEKPDDVGSDRYGADPTPDSKTE